jgi:hypothetical protein
VYTVKIHRSTGYIHIDLSGAEAAVLFEELENVRGGSKLPKVRQVCEGLKESLGLNALMAVSESYRRKYAPRKTLSLVVNDAPRADHAQHEKHVSHDRGGDGDVSTRDATDDPRECEREPLNDR